MRKSKFLNKCLFCLFSSSLIISGLVCHATAGNEEMVDENIKELDELNKQAVRQIPNLPKDGTIDLKAKVFYKDGSPLVEVYEKTVSTEKDQEIDLDKGYTINSEKESEKLP